MNKSHFSRMDENNSLKDEFKLPDFDEHYLNELKDEKETLSKNVKESSHTMRLLENGRYINNFYAEISN